MTMRLVNTQARRVDQAIGLVVSEYRATLQAYEPLETGEGYDSETLETTEAQAIKLRLAVEILLSRAQELEAALVAKTSELWAAGPEE